MPLRCWQSNCWSKEYNYELEEIMLNNIPKSFTPDLVKLMMEMGHGETLLIADGNYPARSTAAPGVPVIHLPVTSIANLLRDILTFFPLDYVPEKPVTIMEKGRDTGAYATYNAIVAKADAAGKIGTVERFAFYEEAAKAVGIVVTADQTPAANVLLQKGVVK
jgi:L-fucose mutarotase